MGFWIRVTASVLFLMFLAGDCEPAIGAAQEKDPETEGVSEGAGNPNAAALRDRLDFSALVDLYYGHNFNRPPSRANGFRNFDVNSGQFSLNLVELAVALKPDPVGFKVHLNFGETARLVHTQEPGASEFHQYLEEAYATYRAPVGRGLTLDLGKFVTQHGAETIESIDNWNYSRSLLFALAIPYYHFGVRLQYPLTEKISVLGSIVNGWNNVVDSNGGKTFGTAIVLNTSKVSLVQNYMTGPEQRQNDNDRRHLWDTLMRFSVTHWWTLMGNYDYGMDRVSGARVRWQGLAAYTRFQILPRFSASFRAEWYDDPQGFTTGLAQKLKEVTGTMEFKPSDDLILRAEYRQDWSDQPSFETRSGLPGRSQQTLTFAAMYAFRSE